MEATPAPVAAARRGACFQVMSFRCQRSDTGNPTRQTRAYQKRKPHPKSRSGCFRCKAKRVKCDESAPSCHRCRRNRVPCRYNSTDDTTSNTYGEAEYSQGDAQPRPGPGTLVPPQVPSPDVIQERESLPGPPRSFLLFHFKELASDLYLVRADQVNRIIDLGMSRPYLLHTLLAVSASHLRHHVPSSASYRVAEYSQQSLAIRDFRSALDEPIDQPTADALLMTSIFLNMLSFSILDEYETPDSWVFSKDDARLDWFSLNMGLKPLLLATSEFRQDSLLRWMYDASDDEEHRFHGEGWELDGVPLPWLKLCGLTDDSTPDNVFYEPVRILAEIKRLEPTLDSIFLYLSFFGKLDIEFRTLLVKQDERAMWIIGFWLGLLCRYDFWWLRKRTTCDYSAIKLWLKDHIFTGSRRGEEAQMWTELMRDLDWVCRWPPQPESLKRKHWTSAESPEPWYRVC